MSQEFVALILAAGKATRFKSKKNKLLHLLLGKPMIQLVLDCVFKLGPKKVYMVVGHQREILVKEPFAKDITFVTQEEQLGTAHAVLAAKKALKQAETDNVFIMNGDLPIIRPETLKPLLDIHKKEKNALTFLTADMEDPSGFGRIIRDEKGRIKVVEEKELTPSQKAIKEANVGIYIFKINELLQALPRISNKNKKGEYYLTDIIEILSFQGKKVRSCKSPYGKEIVGINDRFELAQAVDILRKRKIKSLAEDGVTVYDTSSTWIDLDVKIGRDTVIYSSVVIEGETVIGSNCQIGPFVHIIGSKIGNNVRVLTSSMIEESTVEDEVQIGPFTHMRPKTILRQGSKVGNFVEMKNTVFGRKSKAGHVSYLGDSEIGDMVNIGAGTITCNYDGVKKHKTLIENGVFVGSGTELVAPVKIGKDAYIGAGSTITKDVSPEALALARARQTEKPGWVRRKRKK